MKGGKKKKERLQPSTMLYSPTDIAEVKEGGGGKKGRDATT
jgi:hypothetical protein